MLAYTLRRILLMIPTLLVISFVTFVIIQLPPGDYLSNQIAELRSQGDTAALEKVQFLRKQYGLAVERGTPTGIQAVFSDEPQAVPAPLSYDSAEGFVCVCPNKDNGVYTCDKRARIDGSASFVTGTFGLTAASVVVRALTASDRAAHARTVEEAVAAKAALKSAG